MMPLNLSCFIRGVKAVYIRDPSDKAPASFCEQVKLDNIVTVYGITYCLQSLHLLLSQSNAACSQMHHAHMACHPDWHHADLMRLLGHVMKALVQGLISVSRQQILLALRAIPKRHSCQHVCLPHAKSCRTMHIL